MRRIHIIFITHMYIITVCVVHAKLNNVVFCVSESTDQESMSVYVCSVCDLTQSKFIVAARNNKYSELKNLWGADGAPQT